jgi:hypothetical protein
MASTFYKYDGQTLREHRRAESRKIMVLVVALMWFILGCLIGQAWYEAQDRQRERVAPPDFAFVIVADQGRVACQAVNVEEVKP